MEKGGIRRPGRPVVVGELDPPSALTDRLNRHDGPVVRAGSDALRWTGDGHGTWHLQANNRRWADLPVPGIGGVCAQQNAAVAIAALGLIGAAVQEEALRLALSHVRIARRCQTICCAPAVIVDTAQHPHRGA